MKHKNVFGAWEVGLGKGWIADMSPENVINPNCYWHFTTEADADKFVKLVKRGMEPTRAVFCVENNLDWLE